ncbi:bah-phd domain-containing protein [Micromonas pusilla CCMP1545]|uniref:Bah-phd domain-containing protein n=1 Tax=Micromonas pusilla (strain CCMP1545) TaxID=564608 RepID=C1MGF2_MICPC|nr:bah-phd domain-containing protein [Micromonas pusilla CCMP1545]EEH60015.1 bah-phd domain-containing protein [Micromonas pusilla CCMP1545]|eukprot:XP_003054763.1 bah-phd domain-containing protein [Micromonas pusilla CCMP1545]
MRKNKVEVMVQWYYRPEDAIGGRKGFHGERELFLSDHKDWVAPDSINDKCQVHTLKQYQSLHVVSDVDYFCRFSYNVKKAEYRPARVPVYCVCEMPYNPDRFMVECEACTDWIHPECLRMTKAEVEVMTHFVCPDCTKRHQSEGKRGTP